MEIKKYYLVSNLGDKVDIDLDYYVLGNGHVYIPNSMTLKKPINSDGSKTKYLEFLEKVSQNPGIRNKDVSSEFSSILITGITKYLKLVESNKGYRLTESGEKYLDAVHKDGFKEFEVCKDFSYDHFGITFNDHGNIYENSWELKILDRLPVDGYIFDTSKEFKKFLEDNKLEITINQK